MKGDGRAWTWLVVTRRPKPSEQLRWCHTLYVDVDGYRLAERPSSACQTTDLIELYASRRGLTGRSVGSHCVLYTPYLKIRATFIFWITPSPWNIGNSDRQNAEVARSFVWQFKTMNNLYLSSACVGSENHWNHTIIRKICYLFSINGIHFDCLSTNRNDASTASALFFVGGYWTYCWRVASTSTACVRAGGRHFATMKMRWCDTSEFPKDRPNSC